MNTLRRKTYVINAPAHDGENVLVDTGLINSPTANGLIAVNNTDGTLAFAFNKKGAEFEVIHSAAEVVQVLEITMPAIVASTKYTIIREENTAFMVGRDANQWPNTKKYSYTSPSVLGAAATEKTNAIVALVAKINADESNHATAADKAGGHLILSITEDAGYGLLPSYPGPANWMLTNVPVTAYALTAGKVAQGYGTVMLANKAEWTLDKRYIRNGLEIYNFDKVLPVSTKTYTTLVITEKYGMKDPFAADPNLVSDILVYIDEVSADNLNDFLWALGVTGYTQAQ